MKRIPYLIALALVGWVSTSCSSEGSKTANATNTVCQRYAVGFPFDEGNHCIDTTTPDVLVCADDLVLPGGGINGVSTCVRRKSDGLLLASPVPLEALPSEDFESCPNNAGFSQYSCEFLDCSRNREDRLMVACSVEDFCAVGSIDASTSQCFSNYPIDSNGCILEPCDTDEDCGTGLVCDEELQTTPRDISCAYTVNGDCTCSGLGDGAPRKRCIPE